MKFRAGKVQFAKLEPLEKALASRPLESTPFEMPSRHLPPELYTQIFSNLSSSPLTLYHTLLVSHTFAELVKPILYRHITIIGRIQVRRLLRVKKEDKALVKRITIVGSGPYSIEEGERVKKNDDGPRGGCIRSLLYGQVLDIATVETLEVFDIVEIPEAHFLSNPFKTASKHREISISGHQGGADLWMSYLKHENLPNLRRLGFSDVTRYVPEENGDYSGDESYGYEYAEQAGFVADEWIELPTTLPYSQLEVLVGLPPPNLTDIPGFPLDNFLALVGFPQEMPMHPFVKACRFRFSRTRGFKPSLVDQLRPKSSTGYPHTLHFFISGRYTPNDDRAYQNILGNLRARSIEIHEDENEDEDDSDSLIYPSFVEFLRKAGRLQED